MLRLTSQASELFLQQCAAEQRRLPQMVVANATWKDGALQTTLFEPFEILRHSNRESHRKENENSGDRMRFGSCGSPAWIRNPGFTARCWVSGSFTSLLVEDDPDHARLAHALVNVCGDGPNLFPVETSTARGVFFTKLEFSS